MSYKKWIGIVSCLTSYIGGEYMSDLKEKRIKKLKRKRIWPSIVGLFVIAFVLIIVVVAILGMYIADMVDRKLHEGYKISCNVAEYVVQNLSDLSADELQKHIEFNDSINAIVVFDSNDEIVWSNSDTIPNIDNELIYTDESGMYQNNFCLILESDDKLIFEIDKENIRLSENLLNIVRYKEFLFDEDLLSRESHVPVVETKVWMVVNYDEYKVLVLNNISVVKSELFIIVATFIMMMLLTAVLVVYYILSIIGVAKSQKRITKILYTDMVTGGYNWLHFTKKGDKLLKKSKGIYKYAIVALRMEKYRSFCTCFGVKEGEELLEKIYSALKHTIKKKENLAHHDEADFGLMLMYTSEDDLTNRINSLYEYLGSVAPKIKIKFRFGVCMADDKDKEVDSLYNNATTALDLMPEDTDEKIASYDIEMKKQQLWERKVEDDMDKALVTKQFKLYLQPKYSTKDEKLAGAEALVRWIHPTEGFISPNKFIPIFEKNGFILQLDDYMLEEVALQQSKWQEEGKELFPISVNVSRAHFTRDDLAEHICGIVDKYNIPHNVIELELTESAFFDDKYVLIDTVKQLRDYGFIVSMDDFGAGYSSLNSLKELSIDVLKIDADFFRGTDSVERGMLIVSEVINLAKKLDMKIVAEGIENKEQVEFLTAQECDLIQGYYYAKPLPVEEFEEKYG
ncbi:MAG: EAL domain-containing protein [Lachnospiraceae bacterium]|nr:EAL domain-containing protein [Lachnospiraceae bacterium]